MKAKTKLIASIMSICLVCAVFAIGVFALKTANLKIGGDVSFSATGVEADIKNVTLTGATNNDQVLATGSINTSMTQADIDTTFQNWQTLELDFDANATDIELKFNIANTSTNEDNYIEIDYSYTFSNANPNVDVLPGDENAQSVWENNEYILTPKGSAEAATYETFTLKFKVVDKELNVPQDTKVSVNIALKHITPVEGTVEGTKLTTPDGIIYTLGANNTASLEQKTESYYSVGDNYNSVEKANIAAVITDKTNHYRVTRIGDYAFSHGDFENNTKLKEVTIPNSIISIGEGALRNCTALTYVKIPNSVTICGDYLFCMDTNLGAVSLPNSISTIETSMFCASGITSISIPNSITTIEETAFSYCENLTSITIPCRVASINTTNFFEDCSNLVTVVVAEGNAVYDSRNNCNAIIETATNTLLVSCKASVIPYGVTIVGNGAFSGFSNLSTIIIPTSVKTIESCAFIQSSFTSIIIPYSVTEIGQWAFDGCDGLTNVKIDSQAVVSGLTSKDAQGNVIYYATSVYIKSELDVTTATYLTNTANFTPEKVGDTVRDADGDGYILYTKVA